MLVLTLRENECVFVGGALGDTLHHGDEEVTVKFIRVVREGRVQIGIHAPGKVIQRSVNMKP